MVIFILEQSLFIHLTLGSYRQRLKFEKFYANVSPPNSPLIFKHPYIKSTIG